ncbi:hypothetical protein [Cryptosporangium phraense]|uniref:Uncharacterized protein n=1 Tax=Cryptosporangium phraense TaxID=2593070 RepID=A0A545AFU5_9ACTN|nr:hypothetical protein [Cryptosporangium phraense]TQS40207.1 hypothetical protein FL583_35900 [Cryptosporangium phraense]
MAGFLLFLPFAAAIGFGASWAAFAWRLDREANPLISEIALSRTVVGFAFVVAVSLPYRATDDTVDDVVGKFDESVVVALAVMGVSFAVLYVAVVGTAGDRMREEMGPVLWRAGTAVAGFFVWWFSAQQLRLSSNAGWPLIWVAATVFFFSSLWFIARYWFGINRVHPLLGPAVTAITTVVLSVRELGFEGPPAGFPVRIWLLINVGGLGTALSVCAWEFLETVVAERRDLSWVPRTIAIVGAIGTVAAVGLVVSGAVERAACGSLVRCTPEPEDGGTAGETTVVTVPMLGGVDLDARPPAVASIADPAVDLAYDNSYALGSRLHPTTGRASLWTGAAAPGPDDCVALLRSSPGLGSAGVVPQPGLVLCVGTPGGAVTRVLVRRAAYDGVALETTVWR